MKSLSEYIKEAELQKKAIGHFNISEVSAFKAILTAAQKAQAAVIIGVSEGERNFIGVNNVVALVRNAREEGYPVFLNADHTHTLEGAVEAARAGFDAVLFDAGKLSLEENIVRTKEAILKIREVNPGVLIEAELGYIGAGSVILSDVPSDVFIDSNALTKPEDAARFVRETGVDMIAPAVGNIHGMFENAPNPNLDIERIRAIKEKSGAMMVLHGGSGIKDDDFLNAIEAGMSVVHINTEIRLAWRRGLEQALTGMPKEVAPYKLLMPSIEAMEQVVFDRIKLFARL